MRGETTKKKMGLTTKIFIALLLGLVSGIDLNLWGLNGYLRDTVFVDGICYVIGNGFIRLMKMLVVPLVFTSIVCGASSIGNTKALGKVGIRTIVFYLVTTALAISVAIGVSVLIKPGLGLNMSSIEVEEVAVTESTPATETLLNIIPENPIEALANGTMLQIIFFEIIVGILLAKMNERAEMISNLFTQINDLMMEMTNQVMGFAPVGVYFMLTRTFANLGFDAFVPLLKYMGSVTISLAIQCFGVYMLLLLTEPVPVRKEVFTGNGVCVFYINL